MKTTTFSQLRNNAKKYFDAVEKRGEEIEVYRHGKPIALISPIRAQNKGGWKKTSPLDLGSVSLSKIVLSERKKG